MNEMKISVLTKSKVHEISADRVILEQEEGTEEITGVDTVVIAIGSKPKNDLTEFIQQEGIPVYNIGDSVKPRRIFEAIHEGFKLAYSL
jgi:NADH dehydrogenase FAD-containing subunit